MRPRKEKNAASRPLRAGQPLGSGHVRHLPRCSTCCPAPNEVVLAHAQRVAGACGPLHRSDGASSHVHHGAARPGQAPLQADRGARLPPILCRVPPSRTPGRSVAVAYRRRVSVMVVLYRANTTTSKHTTITHASIVSSSSPSVAHRFGRQAAFGPRAPGLGVVADPGHHGGQRPRSVERCAPLAQRRRARRGTPRNAAQSVSAGPLGAAARGQVVRESIPRTRVGAERRGSSAPRHGPR